MWSYDKPGTKDPIHKIPYNLSQDYLKIIAKWTYVSDLQANEISVKNIVS